ncbi:MAG: hypothetical protein EXR63_02610 [Dehalococcoidia bacterium]|nr:hypothetical protein [Dehalococcoidia bacterium]
MAIRWLPAMVVGVVTLAGCSYLALQERGGLADVVFALALIGTPFAVGILLGLIASYSTGAGACLSGCLGIAAAIGVALMFPLFLWVTVDDSAAGNHRPAGLAVAVAFGFYVAVAAVVAAGFPLGRTGARRWRARNVHR